MDVGLEQVRGYRLRAHHLDRKLPPGGEAEAAGACGVQNSPPGAWETALFNRVEGCTQEGLQSILYEDKELLQAWSCRGVPMVFPTGESGVFLDALRARPGEEPWIYTRGIGLALDHLGMTFDELLPLVEKAAGYLDNHTVKSKEALDQTLAALVGEDLPPEKRALWEAPSMYGAPDRQTVGGAAVSFLLRPCAFSAKVVFGAREGNSPAFTSFQNWVGRAPAPRPEAERELARKFLRCYGPSGPAAFQDWLGASPRQAKRLWESVSAETVPVRVAGRTRYLLAEELEALAAAGDGGDRLLLLGPHDPYLDLRDREVVLADPALQKRVWRTVANPGAVLKGGRVIGIWKGKTLGDRLDADLTVWEPLSRAEEGRLEELAGEYAAFRRLTLRRCLLEKL